MSKKERNKEISPFTRTFYKFVFLFPPFLFAPKTSGVDTTIFAHRQTTGIGIHTETSEPHRVAATELSG